MSFSTGIWITIAGICVAMAAFYLTVRFKSRQEFANLFFSISTLSAARPVAMGLLIYTMTSVSYACPMKLPMIDVTVGDAVLQLEVAARPDARECGLSRRTTLPPSQGMLFVVPEPMVLDFWMANTSLQLSIAFADSSGHILSINKMLPDQPRKHYLSPSPARYAIEVNQDWFEEHGVKPGDRIDIHLPVMFLVR